MGKVEGVGELVLVRAFKRGGTGVCCWQITEMRDEQDV